MNKIDINISNLRQDYRASSLLENDIEKNPLNQFNNWFNDALKAEVLEPNAMTIATAGNDGKPSARIVLLKEVIEEGFIFFTNYDSKKGHQIHDNKNVALLFFWGDLERQIRIEGTIEKISEENSTQYFHSRPKGSQLGAHASPQSKVIPNREFLEKNLKSLEKEFENKEIPKPSHWGGYLIKPTLIEFWQGRSNRLHDRITYTLLTDNSWKIERLAP